jgi:NADP-dependent 3-hydroxy acid dehydrogenase YdfG
VLSILARGDRVIATARSLDKLNELTSSLTPELAQRLRIAQLDVTEGEEAIHLKIALMAKFWGRIDVLVNNAGSFQGYHHIGPSSSVSIVLSL